METSGSSSGHHGKEKPRPPPRRPTEENPNWQTGSSRSGSAGGHTRGYQEDAKGRPKAPVRKQMDDKSNNVSDEDSKTRPESPTVSRGTRPKDDSSVNASERISVTEEDCYESLSKDEPKKKRPERRTDLLSPAGGIITSAEILNARADQFGWLWRKERMFRSRERYWALLYHKVIYLYLDSKDKEEQETIDLKQGAAVKVQRDKSRFVITLSNPSGKHDFQAVDKNTAESWIKVLETKIVK